eukprot:5988751-Heterocapsa_arctica.AAC.1
MIASDKLQVLVRFSTGRKGTFELSVIPHLSSHAGITIWVRGLVIEHMLKAHRIVLTRRLLTAGSAGSSSGTGGGGGGGSPVTSPSPAPPPSGMRSISSPKPPPTSRAGRAGRDRRGVRGAPWLGTSKGTDRAEPRR